MVEINCKETVSSIINYCQYHSIIKFSSKNCVVNQSFTKNGIILIVYFKFVY
jgi:hypothetical protein